MAELLTTIPVKSDHFRSIRLMHEKMGNARIGMTLAVEEYNKRSLELFQAVEEVYPELQDYEYALSANSQEFHILSNRKRDWGDALENLDEVLAKIKEREETNSK